MSKWSTKYPKKEGFYWFYGYRFGKVSCGKPETPELYCVKVRKISNGFLYVINGTVLDKSEVEEPHFLKLETPELPKLK